METAPPPRTIICPWLRWTLDKQVGLPHLDQAPDCVAHEDIPAPTVGCARADLRRDRDWAHPPPSRWEHRGHVSELAAKTDASKPPKQSFFSLDKKCPLRA
jgi:hypothetical protein